MGDDRFKYDVAFSFLAQDEELAIQINDLLKDRVTTFIYTQKQKEIAGTDGEETFNRVFGSEARTVFVLYREGWGKTPWTRIEETAIHNRGFEEGYDFALFAPLDKPPSIPKWYPKNRIWVGLERWGIEGAANIIETRVREAGGEPKEETAEQIAVRLGREIASEKTRQIFLHSENGVKSANNEIAKLLSELEKTVSNVAKNGKTVSLTFKKFSHECAVYGAGFSVSLTWERTYSNTLESSALYLYLWKGAVRLLGDHSLSFERPEKIGEIEFGFDLDKAGKPVWRERGNKKHYSTEDLCKLCIVQLFGEIRNQTLSEEKDL
jgi:hypothetical protein